MNELVHAFDIKHGTIYVYSDNLKIFQPYFENLTDCVEDVIKYCKYHNINVCYISNHPILGMYETVKVLSIMKRFGFVNDVQHFFKFID